MASSWVGSPQVGALAASGCVALRLPLPEVVVTWFVTGFVGRFLRAEERTPTLSVPVSDLSRDKARILGPTHGHYQRKGQAGPFPFLKCCRSGSWPPVRARPVAGRPRSGVPGRPGLPARVGSRR
jgi:hypothetical protein